LDHRVSTLEVRPPFRQGVAMKVLRKLHLLLGVFFTPMLLFFVVSGWYQTFDTDRLKSPSEAESLVQRLRVIHTDQIYPTNHEVRRPSSPRLFKLLVGLMSAAVVVTTVLGLILAFKFSRSLATVCICLLAGLAMPIVLLWLGQAH
jgi:hypothetical protein